ncbi:hypothetical protein [Aquitalea aquatilis]|uniref:hypothetical protein n=1 Tax=Aquitalea aquatilis TaxID=1537400 RepID=UPI0010BD9C66|nr:hypothetical protein [Aquitalea aquatilis]
MKVLNWACGDHLMPLLLAWFCRNRQKTRSRPRSWPLHSARAGTAVGCWLVRVAQAGAGGAGWSGGGLLAGVFSRPARIYLNEMIGVILNAAIILSWF